MLKLQKLRQQLDEVDKKLIKILAKRFVLTKKIGIYKKKHNLPIRDLKREKEMFIQRKVWADKFNLDSKLIEHLFKLIIKNVLKEHKRIKNSSK